MTDEAPRVSVLMSVWNGERHLRESVDSILNQTFGDFEFIIINDGSTDSTREILESYHDPRIRLIHQENIGLTCSLNKALALARGEYIARMDADDIALPDRFARQCAVLDEDPSISVVDTVTEWFEGCEKTVNFAERHAALPVELLDGSCVTHSCVMMRKRDILEVGGYDDHFKYAQDHDLWLRLAWRGKRFHLIDQVLFKVRCDPAGISRARNSEQWAFSREARLRVIQGIHEGRYFVPPELEKPLADVLLKLAHRWLKRGWNTDARKAARAHLRMRPSSATAMKIVARSYKSVRRCYDTLASLRRRMFGGVRDGGEA